MTNYTVLRHLRLIPGDGRPAVEDAVLAMRHDPSDPAADRLLYCGPAPAFDPAQVSDGTVRELDLSGGCYTALPGLINTHVHLDLQLPYLPYYLDTWGNAYRALVVYRRAAEALLQGVTTVRGTGIVGESELAVKKAVSNGLLWGPRIISCGSPLVPHAGHGYTIPGSIQCSGPDEFIRALRGQLAAGADQIKIMYTGGLAGAFEGTMDIQMTEEEVAACIRVAHGNSRKVSAHLSNDAAIAQAVRLGIDGVEHGYTLSAQTVQAMAAQGTYYTPTLCVSHCNDYMQRLGVPAYTLEKQASAAAAHIESCRRAAQAGVTLCTGTDLLPSDPIGGTCATTRETELLVEEIGLTPLEAIQAATWNGARLCGVERETGSLEAGKCGDFLLVEGKPDQQIRALRNLRLIARNCRIVRSRLPGLQEDNLTLLPPGVPCEGGVFKTW